MRLSPLLVVTATVLLLSATACLAGNAGRDTTGAPAEPEDLTDISALPLVVCEGEPPARQTLMLREIWRLDLGEESDVLAGRIGRAVSGLDGRILLLDWQLNHVLVVDPAGRVEGILGHEGEGPGETTAAYDLFQLPDGRLGILEGCPPMAYTMGAGRIIVLDSAGDPAAVWHPARESVAGSIPSLRAVRQAKGRLLVGYNLNLVSPPDFTFISALVLCDDQGGVRAVLAERRSVSALSDLKARETDIYEPFGQGGFDIAPDGRMAMAPEREHYLVVIRRPDGGGLRLERPWEPCRRSDEELQRLERRYGGSEYFEVSETEPVIRRLRWRPDGMLWVEHCRSRRGREDREAGIFTRFDEFAADGGWRREVALALPGDPATDRLQLLDDGRFVLILNVLTAEDQADKVAAGGGELEVVLLEAASP